MLSNTINNLRSKLWFRFWVENTCCTKKTSQKPFVFYVYASVFAALILPYLQFKYLWRIPVYLLISRFAFKLIINSFNLENKCTKVYKNVQKGKLGITPVKNHKLWTNSNSLTSNFSSIELCSTFYSFFKKCFRWKISRGLILVIS